MDRLTPAERRLLPYLVTGLDMKTLARLVNIQHQTLRNHKLEIESKLGVRGTAQLVIVILLNGEVDNATLHQVWREHAPNLLEAICNGQPQWP